MVGTYGDTLEQAAEFAAAALALMAKHQVPASPNNFEVWYAYASGNHPDLKRTMDILIDNEQEFGPDRCAELYDKFFTVGMEGTMVSTATQRLESQLETLLGLIEGAGEGAKHYGNALSQISGKMAVEPAEGFRAVVETAIAATKAMETRARRLEKDLDHSSEEIKKLRTDLENMRQEAMTDGLTGLANRKCFDERLRASALESMEEGSPLSLLMVDIDHFKEFNDRYGHQVGDQVLRLLGMTLKKEVKGGDTPARFGGEEFAVILPETDLDHARQLAERLRAAIAGKHLLDRKTGREMGKIAVSIGVGEFELGEPLGQLVSRADQALYQAKRAGRDRVVTQDEVGTAVFE